MITGLRYVCTRLAQSGFLGLALMVLVIFSFRSAIADWNDVPTGSMRPTIMIGDRIFVNKLAYDLKIPFTDTAVATWSNPQKGDIVTCWSPKNGDRLVKRVVAVPGDVIAMQGGRLILNGQPLKYEPTTAASEEALAGRVFFTENLDGVQHTVAYDPAKKALRDFGPIQVQDGKYFMMGDNRDNSADSRYFGFVPREDICGKVTGLALSVDRENHFKPRWERFFTALN